MSSAGTGEDPSEQLKRDGKCTLCVHVSVHIATSLCVGTVPRAPDIGWMRRAAGDVHHEAHSHCHTYSSPPLRARALADRNPVHACSFSSSGCAVGVCAAGAKELLTIDAKLASIAVVPNGAEGKDTNFPRNLHNAAELFLKVGMAANAKRLHDATSSLFDFYAAGPDGRTTLSMGRGCVCWNCGHVTCPPVPSLARSCVRALLHRQNITMREAHNAAPLSLSSGSLALGADAAPLPPSPPFSPTRARTWRRPTPTAPKACTSL